MDKCNLHTILRLPTGIFYAQGVKTNVLFFQRGASDKGNTKAVWFYDMRTNMPAFGKRTPLNKEHFKPFELAYGDDPNGNSARVDEGENGRWRRFTREEISKRGENLDITWLRDESLQSGDNLPEPEIIAAEIMTKLQTAMDEMEAKGAAVGRRPRNRSGDRSFVGMKLSYLCALRVSVVNKLFHHRDSRDVINHVYTER